VVHAAMVIDDGLIGNTTAAQQQAVLAPKVLGALHLDELTRPRTGDAPLDFFVLYSSATTLFGSPGQGSYVAANMALQALAASRRAEGLPATCIAWGPIDDAGYLARHEQVKGALLARMGGAALKADHALAQLEHALVHDAPPLSVMDLDWSTLSRHLPSAATPRYAQLVRQGRPGGADDAHDLRRRLDMLPAAELEKALVDVLRQAIGEILRIAPERLDADRPVQDMGMDSMMGVELASALEARLGINLPVMAISEGSSIARLARRIGQQMRPTDEPQGTAPQPAREAQQQVLQQVQHVARQHAGDLSADALHEFSADFADAADRAMPLVPDAVSDAVQEAQP
jgi:phthiocerol/phenolphthiocerol synthesis type-I polyketide synthase C